MKLKVGKSCKTGQILALSRAGNLIPAKADVNPIGTALHRLIRGRIAVDNGRGGWLLQGTSELSLIAQSYLPREFISELVLPSKNSNSDETP